MGKNDKKTRKGKIRKGSYGVTRPQKKANKIASFVRNVVAEKVEK